MSTHPSFIVRMTSVRFLTPVALFILSFLCVIKSPAATRNFGLGIVVAGPTGLTGEYVYGHNRDVAASIGWATDSLYLTIDHHWNRKDWIKADGVGINVYYGLGVRYLAWQDRDAISHEIGARVPLGIQHIFREIPLQIFIELAPALILVDHTAFIIDLALGARYFF
ncbi:MAG: hypothetical protein H7249_20385 [Chitinophagaceae bacterium]|nr:hypothetical protein [Oligoflexus sp.]